MTVYENIKKIAKKRGKTLQEVAIESGLSKNMIYQYRPGYGRNRKGKNSDIQPSYETTCKIANTLKVPREVIKNDKLADLFINEGMPAVEQALKLMPTSKEIAEATANFNDYLDKLNKISKEEKEEKKDQPQIADLTSPIFALNGQQITGEAAEDIRKYAEFVANRERNKNK